MLDSLRQGANSWLAKALMGLLVLSFGVWGVRYSDLGGNNTTLLQVGGQNITANQYQALFNQELMTIENQTHKQIDPKIAHQLGLDQQVFSGLVVDANARVLNLGISDQALLDRLKGQKELQRPDGQFDPDAFRYMLSNMRLSEQAYFDMMRRNSVRDQLLGSVTASAPAPLALAEAVNQFDGEERSVDYFIVPVSKAPASTKADDTKLKEYFEAHPEQYKAPEYRTVGVLLATPDDLKSGIEVSDDQAKAVYEATKANYVVPEHRHAQIMSFQDKAAADKAFAALKTGKDFMAVAKDMGLADKDVDRGMITKADLLDKVVAEATFKLEKDKVSDPIDGALATSIVRVTEIQPGSSKSFDEVKAQIKDQSAREQASRQLIDYRGKVEDERAGGRQLKEMPAKFPFKYNDVPPADASGNGVDGKPLAVKLPNLPAILKVAFQSDVGVETDPIDLGKDGWAWVEVKEVKAARQKTFDEVKADVETAYQASVTAAGLAKYASDLSDRANKGEDFAKLATEGGGQVKTVAGITRRTQNPDLPPTAVQLAFALAKGSASATTAADDKSRIVFRLTDIKPAKPLDATRQKQLTEGLARQLAGGLEGQYVQGLQQTYGFHLDEAQFRQIVGAPGADQSDQ